MKVFDLFFAAILVMILVYGVFAALGRGLPIAPLPPLLPPSSYMTPRHVGGDSIMIGYPRWSKVKCHKRSPVSICEDSPNFIFMIRSK